MINSEHSKIKALFICLIVYLVALFAAWYSTLFFINEYSLLFVAFIADIVATLVVFIFSVIFKNASLYDPYWSVAPPVIIGYWVCQPEMGFSHSSILIFVVTLFWSVRLTINWIRGWRGLGHEDWRYIQLRNQNPRLYPFINLSGIHLFPTIMVFMCLVPAFFAIKTPETNLNITVKLGVFLSIAATIFAFIADEQMRNFRRSDNESACMESGLWKYSRHPNYLGEIIFWFGIWLIAIGINITFYWTIFGCIALILMFIFISIPMMEKRSLSKRKEYAEVMKRVPMLLGFRIPDKK